jgi:hypothetical protein
MSTPLTLNVSSPARIHSWRDLLDAATALHEDSTAHQYGAFRSSGRAYCANVKVHSWGRLEKAIEKLGAIPESAKEAIQEHFDDSEIQEIWNLWIEDASSYLKDWFKGCSHSGPKHYEELIAQIKAGEDTCYPAIRELPTKSARIKEVKSWAKEDALFLEALRAADDGDSIVWEGRSGGYITWDANRNVEYLADELICDCENALEGNRDRDFRDVLADFRSAERTHHLNLALIDYLKAWADRMDFQDELEYRVSEFYSDNEDSYTEAESIFETHADLMVTFADSIACGNCQSGTANWAHTHFPGRSQATVAEILAIEDSKPLARRACRKAIQRHLAA